jgi:PKD domain
MKKYIRIILLCTTLAPMLILNVSALMITEIMYDPEGADTGNEWIEVYNDDKIAQDMVLYKLFESNISHGITLPSTYGNIGGSIIDSDEYAVIADNVVNFIAMYPNYKGKLFDSAFSLINSGEIIEMRKNNVAESSVNYIPDTKSNGTGGTLNNINKSWQAYIASPGASSTMLEVNPNQSSTNTATTTTNVVYNSGYYSSSYRLGNIRMLLPKEMNVALGAKAEFFVKFLDSKDNILHANIYWSFGDGAESEGATITHRYYREGHYIAFVEGVTSTGYGIERINVNVIKPNISILDVRESYIVLKNLNDEELDIGGFYISSDQGIFKLSRILLIAPNGELVLDSEILGYKGVINNVKLLSAYNTLIYDYNKSKSEMSTNTKLSPNLISLNHKEPQTKALSKVKLYKSLQPNQKAVPKSLPSPIIISTSTSRILDVKSTNSKEIEVENSNIQNIISQPVETASSKFLKNWLYWLYD